MEHPTTISKSIGLSMRKDKLYYVKYSRAGIPFSGEKTHYYRNGELCFRGNYEGGKPNGVHEYYSANGCIKEISYKDGKINCIEFYDENRKLRATYPCENGLRHGVSKRYDENGKLKVQETFKNRVHHGWRSHFWHGTKQAWTHGFFENGKIMWWDDDPPDGPKNEKEEKEIEESATQLSFFT